GQAMYFQYDDASGNITSVTALNGQTTTTDYDAFGREVAVTNPDGVTLSTEYDQCSAIGSCPAINGVTASLRIKQASPVSPTSYQYLDSFGRLIRQETQSFSGTNNVYQDIHYDAVGQVDKESVPYYSGDTVLYIDED